MIETEENGAPIACALPGGEFKERTAWIAQLNSTALIDARREGLCLRLTYRREAAESVRLLVERERACCAFLTFELEEDADALRLTVTAPAHAAEAAEAIFAPLMAKSESEGCGCHRSGP